VSEAAEPARLVNVRQFLMGVTADGASDVLPLLSPKVVYTVPGHGPLAGVYRGPDEVAEHIRKLFRVTSGTFQILKWVDFLVGLSHVAAVQYAQAQGDGIVYRGHQVYLVETDQQDLVTRIQVFFEDQTVADTFFASLSRE
jgi:ketosteroid isomerase-like protein